MGSDVGQIFPTASYYRAHSILYALVCEKELSHMGKNSGNLDLLCEKDTCVPHILSWIFPSGETKWSIKSKKMARAGLPRPRYPLPP